MAEWTNASDCKSDTFGLRWFESNSAHLIKMKTRIEQIELEPVSRTDVERLAKRLGKESAAQQALDKANKYISCSFFIGKTKNSYTIAVRED